MNNKSSMSEILDTLRANPCCKIHSPTGVPHLSEKHRLPNDLKEFYALCGGVEIYVNRPYGFQILSPKQFLLVNPLLIGELYKDDISSEWYTIARDADGNYITIDLNPLRSGRCYDSFWDRHGVVGECAIVALSFSELMLSLYDNEGKSVFWLDKGFDCLGDAYDA